MLGKMLVVAMLFVGQYLGLACLALSQQRHWQQVTTAPVPAPRPNRLLRTIGALLLGASLLPALFHEGADFGAVMWVMTLIMAGIVVTFTLSWKPALLRPLARILSALRS